MLEGEQGIPALGLALPTPRAQTSITATFGTAMCDAVKMPGLDNTAKPTQQSTCSLKKTQRLAASSKCWFLKHCSLHKLIYIYFALLMA